MLGNELGHQVRPLSLSMKTNCHPRQLTPMQTPTLSRTSNPLRPLTLALPMSSTSMYVCRAAVKSNSVSPELMMRRSVLSSSPCRVTV